MKKKVYFCVKCQINFKVKDDHYNDKKCTKCKAGAFVVSLKHPWAKLVGVDK